MNHGFRSVCGGLIGLGALWGSGVQAQPFAPGQPLDAQAEATALPPLQVDPEAGARWVLGMAITSSPSRAGASDRSVGLRPVLAGRVGRWMLATSSARSLSGGSVAGGVSTQWEAANRWKLGVGFRLTHGRTSADDPLLVGLPDVKRSLAMRLSAGYALSERWRASVGWQQDLAHRQGGRATLGVGWQQPVADRWVLDASLGATWANTRAMQTFHGVTAAQANASRPLWQPGGGWEQWHWGLGMSKAVDRHWRVSVQVGQGRLLGAAAHSPLTTSRLSTTGQVMLAYVGW
ncbi:MipA/OmpV family protein [Hydrogenophaga soli]